MSACPYTVIGICFARAPTGTGYAIFGFSEFLAALALLILVFSSSDFVYQFRISVAALPLKWISFGAAAGIGVGTLLTDLWFARNWYAPDWGFSRAGLQASLGAVFLSTVLLWIWVAYMRPPVFSRWNYKHFYGSLFRTIVRGSETQLAVLAAELMYSAKPLVRLSNVNSQNGKKHSKRSKEVAGFAHDAILLLNNRKLCRHIVASSPITAIVFMQEAAEQKRYSIPLGGFAKNVTEEALRNRDSILFHEDRFDDVLGTVQPFSTAMYGNYRLIEGIGRPIDSPLDIDWKLAWDLDGPQFEAYCRITLLTFKDYISSGSYHSRSTALNRAFEIIKGAGRELYKLDNQPLDAIDSTPVKRLSAAVEFVKDAIRFLGEQKELDFGPLRVRKEGAGSWHRWSVFDELAELVFELVFQASAVKGPPDNAWWIHYNTVWGDIFAFHGDTPAWKVVRFKITRLLYDEIKRLEDLPNFKSSRVLGFCLNVLGLSIAKGSHRDRSEYPLRVAVLNWTKKHYLRLRQVHPPVAESCLIGSIAFDIGTDRLFKTYSQGLSLEPSREYFDLDPASPVATPFAVVRQSVRRVRNALKTRNKKEAKQ